MMSMILKYDSRPWSSLAHLSPGYPTVPDACEDDQLAARNKLLSQQLSWLGRREQPA